MESYIRQELIKPIRQAVEKYRLIEEGDKIIVGLSGGKDSLLLSLLMGWLKKYRIYDFELLVVHVDAGYHSDFTKVKEILKEEGIDFHIEVTNINEQIDLQERKSVCYRCARLRKGVLKRLAIEKGFNKIAVGHHMDDVIETFFMNMFENGKMAGMPPIRTEASSGLSIIRPMIGLEEQMIKRAGELLLLPVIQSSCPYNGETNRERYKEWVETQTGEFKDFKRRIISAMGNVWTDELL